MFSYCGGKTRVRQSEASSLNHLIKLSIFYASKHKTVTIIYKISIFYKQSVVERILFSVNRKEKSCTGSSEIWNG